MFPLRLIVSCCCFMLWMNVCTAQSYSYTFEAPVFTNNETLPILTRVPNVGGVDFTTSFTSSTTSNGFNISSFLTAPLSGLSLIDTGAADSLTLTFSRPVSFLSFGAATSSLANQANGRINLNWGTGQQDFTTVTQLPNNFQVGSPSITFPSPITTLDISAFNGSNVQVRLFMDNLNLTAVAVPEPASVALVGGALLGLSYVIYRRRASRREVC
ncbi:MAG TPA: PEP-CTERM sorting domain-containing protein, partial [Gemmatales bacterium]|nr:PEP-CTERM sorting domain-containing protein [Gemmatales bacterium]